MPERVDRGLVVLRPESDGTTSVSVCAKVVDGRATTVFARYRHADRVHVDPRVELAVADGRRYSTEILDVVGDDGVVTLRPAR